jgi:engulfment/cell motility protein 1
MSSHTIEDLTSCILDFQANIVRVTYRKKMTLVEPEIEPAHTAVLESIWAASRAQASDDGQGGLQRWQKLGMASEDVGHEFGDVGVLGLHCLVRLSQRSNDPTKLTGAQQHFVEQDPDHFSKIVMEQLSRPTERRCPVVRASNEIVGLLSEHWEIYAPGCT